MISDFEYLEADNTMIVHFEETPSMYQNRPLRFAIVLILCFFAVGLPIMLYWYLRAKNMALAIVDDEVVFTEGLFKRSRTELKVAGIRTIKIEQPLFSRALGLARVEIYTAGLKPEISVGGIKNVWAFDQIIKDIQRDIFAD